MKQLIASIRRSVYDPAYYQEVLTKPLRYSWKYYSALSLLVAVFLTIISSIPLVILANKAVHEFPERFFAYYPDGFEVHIVNGVLSTNVVEPYVLPIPSHLKSIAKEDGVTSLAVFDTKTPFSREQFDAHHTLILVGADYLAYRDESTSVHIERFEPNANFSITEGFLKQIESFISPYYRLVGPLIVMGIFVGLLLFLGFNFLYLLFGALCILVLTRMMNITLSYGKSYQVGLHASTLSVLLNVVLSITPFTLYAVPFLSTIIMLTVVYFNFSEAPSAVTLDPAPAPTSEDNNLTS